MESSETLLPPIPARRFQWSRQWWKLGVILTASTAVYALTIPLVTMPGMGPLNFMESGKLQGQGIKMALAVAGLGAVLGLGRLAGIASGIAAGLALGVGCQRWKNIQEQKEMNAEMMASGSGMGDMSSMLEICVEPGTWILARSLVLLLLCCLASGWKGRRKA